MLNNIFNFLPLAAIIDNNIFCVHSGLSPLVSTIQEINNLNRFVELPDEGPITDLVWNVPLECYGWRKFVIGAQYYFGSDISEQFLKENNLSLICRSHDLEMEGYRFISNNMVISIFSAPNFCNRCGNLGAIMELDENGDKRILQFRQCIEQGEEIRKRCPDYFL